MAAAPILTSGDEVKSYREWKVSKIHEIEDKIRDLKAKTKDPNLVFKKGPEAGLSAELQSELEQEMLNLSISQDLTISDYFVGYLTKQGSLDAAVKNVAGRLTSDEVAELMLAYAGHFFQSRPTSLKVAPRADSGQ